MQRPFVVAFAAVAAVAAATPARAAGDARLEVAPVMGAWIPIGHARQDFEAAPLAGMQLAYDVDPRVAVVGTFSWTATSARQLSDARLDLLQWDLGLRGQRALSLGRAATLRPSVGVGVGQVRFLFRDAQHADGPGFAFYSSAGVELGYRAMTAGLTFRHQMHSVDANALGTSPIRQNLQLFASAGLRL